MGFRLRGRKFILDFFLFLSQLLGSNLQLALQGLKFVMHLLGLLRSLLHQLLFRLERLNKLFMMLLRQLDLLVCLFLNAIDHTLSQRLCLPLDKKLPLCLLRRTLISRNHAGPEVLFEFQINQIGTVLSEFLLC